MKNLLLLALLSISAIYGWKVLNAPQLHVETPIPMEPAPKKGAWLQERIAQNQSALNRGAYNQKYNVAHAATFYNVPDVKPTPIPTPYR